MTLVDRMLKRLGLVKLSRFGLVLTAEGRIMSLRSTVLDDGLGGRIVGWHDRDLAAMELDPMSLAPAPQKAVAPAVAISLPPVSRPPVPKAPPVTPVKAPVPVPVASVPAVAVAEEMDEDDWEWHIALARARAAAEEADHKAAQARFRDTIPTVRPVPALGTVPPPIAAASPVVPIPVGKSRPGRHIPLRPEAPRTPSIARNLQPVLPRRSAQR
jgi:hypothetical protein